MTIAMRLFSIRTFTMPLMQHSRGRISDLRIGIVRPEKEDIADQIKEADPGSAPEQWDAVLEHVKAASEMRGLGELLLPTHTATQLMTLDPTLMPIKEMSEELRRWSTESRTAFAVLCRLKRCY